MNQPINRDVGNNDNRVMGEYSKKDECFECHGYGHRAFECATRLNRLRQESHVIPRVPFSLLISFLDLIMA